jgi:septal ring factor EnvC (AmiA/AmiB activator)
MYRSRLVRKVIGAGTVLALAVAPLVTGCVAMASQEQMRMLDEARKKAEAAEADLKACKEKQAQLERDIAARKQTLAKYESDVAAVKKGLENWPRKESQE